jgi:hypothetical protein
MVFLILWQSYKIISFFLKKKKLTNYIIIKIQKNYDLTFILKSIYLQKGISGFYKGFLATLLRDIP